MTTKTKQRVDAIHAQRKALLDRAESQQRDLTDDEQTQFDALGEERERLLDLPVPARTIGLNTPLQPMTFTTGGNPTGRSTRGGETCGFSSIGEIMLSVFRACDTTPKYDARLDGLRDLSSMNTISGAAGGYAVPSQMIYDLLNVPAGDFRFPLLASCRRYNAAAPKCRFPQYNDDSHASTSPYGITWSAIPEGGDYGTVQSVPMKALDLSAVKHGAWFGVTREFLQDAGPGVIQSLDAIFAYSLRFYIEGLLWTGTGAGQPIGVLNAASTIEVAKAGGQAADTIVVQNIDAMWARLLEGRENNAIWVANKTCFPQLANLARVNGTSGTPVLQPNVREGPPQVIDGRPLYYSEHLPTLGSSGDLVLIDPSMYVLAERLGVTIEVLREARAQYGEIVFQVFARFDGAPEMSTVHTPKNGDTQSFATKIAER